LDLTDRIDKQDNKKAFIFSTSTVPLEFMHKTLKGKLIEKGFDIMGHYYCKDFKRAQEFNLSIKEL
jgi:hypothetical protein